MATKKGTGSYNFGTVIDNKSDTVIETLTTSEINGKINEIIGGVSNPSITKATLSIDIEYTGTSGVNATIFIGQIGGTFLLNEEILETKHVDIDITQHINSNNEILGDVIFCFEIMKTRDVVSVKNVTISLEYDCEITNKIYIGTSQLKSLYIGTSEVKSVYVGTTKVYG